MNLVVTFPHAIYFLHMVSNMSICCHGS